METTCNILQTNLILTIYLNKLYRQVQDKCRVCVDLDLRTCFNIKNLRPHPVELMLNYTKNVIRVCFMPIALRTTYVGLLTLD